MPDARAMSPTSAEVESTLFGLQSRFPQLLNLQTPGRSAQGRPLYSVTVNDPQRPDDDKQHVLVLAGVHGEEESGRMIALALLEWLTCRADEQARSVLRSQKIVVLPNANPDGAEADTYTTAEGVNLNKDFAVTGPVSPEGRFVEAVANELHPELVVDMHCRGHAGCSYDMVLYPWTRPYTEDARVMSAMADESAAAGEHAGIPHAVHPLTWPGWWENIPADEEPHLLSFMYRSFKSLCLCTETSESNAFSSPAPLRTAVGMARLGAMLDWGQRRHPGSVYPGYPVEVVLGLISGRCITATGATAGQRRRSRLGIWRNAASFSFGGSDGPERPEEKRLRLSYNGPPLADGAACQFRAVGGWTVAGAQLNGRELSPSAFDGFHTWRDPCSTFVRFNLPSLSPGTYDFSLQLRP
jgi:hypothetical protein